MVVMVYWVTTVSSFLDSGTKFTTGSLVMTTPAAWVEVFRGIPSRAFAVSMRVLTRSSPSYISLSCGDCRRASSRVICGVVGTSFATTSVSA